MFLLVIIFLISSYLFIEAKDTGQGKHIVEFIVPNEEESYFMRVDKGKSIKLPESPKIEYKEFLGWHKDKFGDPSGVEEGNIIVNKDMTFYGLYQDNNLGNKNLLIDNFTIEEDLNLEKEVIESKVKNKSKEEQKCSIIPVIFEIDEDLNEVFVDYEEEKLVLKPGEEKPIHIEIDIPDVKMYKLKVFIWDSLEGQSIITEKILETRIK